jgi:hypothetical protein
MPILTVNDLKIGKIALVPPSALLPDRSGKLYRASTSQVYSELTPLATVTIRKQDHKVEVDGGTLGYSRFVPGYLPYPRKGQVTYIPVEVVDYYIGKTAAELDEGEIAYIIPWAIFPNILGGGSSDSTVTCTRKPAGTSIQKIKKQKGKILIERSIIRRRLTYILEGASSGCDPSELHIKIVNKIYNDVEV